MKKVIFIVIIVYIFFLQACNNDEEIASENIYDEEEENAKKIIENYQAIHFDIPDAKFIYDIQKFINDNTGETFYIYSSIENLYNEDDKYYITFSANPTNSFITYGSATYFKIGCSKDYADILIKNSDESIFSREFDTYLIIFTINNLSIKHKIAVYDEYEIKTEPSLEIIGECICLYSMDGYYELELEFDNLDIGHN